MSQLEPDCFRNSTENTSWSGNGSLSARPSSSFSSTGMVTAYSLATSFSVLSIVLNVVLLTVIVRGLWSLKSGSQILVANLIINYTITAFYTQNLTKLGFIGLATIFPAIQAIPSPSRCTFFLVAGMADYASGLWNNVFLCVNRLAALYFPHQYTRIAGRSINVLLSVLCWVIGILLVLPMIVIKGHVATVSNLTGLCKPDFSGPLMSTVFALMGVVPYVFIFVTSAAIIIRAYRTIHLARNRGTKNSDKLFRQFERRLNLAKLLFYSFLWLTLSRLPGIVAHSAFPDWTLRNPAGETWFSSVLVAVDNAINPIIFFALSQDYRAELRHLCGRAGCVRIAVGPDLKSAESDTLQQKSGVSKPTGVS